MTSFSCPRCDTVSHNPVDVAEGYCGVCHDWTDRPRAHSTPEPGGQYVLRCPVDECPWQHVRPNPGQVIAQTPMPEGDAPHERIRSLITGSIHAEQHHTETVVRAHLDTHQVEDYLRTIQRLHNELNAARNGPSPTVPLRVRALPGGVSGLMNDGRTP